MNAYEELKAWCEKYLKPYEYKAVPESDNYCPTIYFDPENNSDVPCLVFDYGSGDFNCSMVCTNEEMCEHIMDCDRNTAPEVVADPPLTSISGMMVRKMIEMYEQNQK